MIRKILWLLLLTTSPCLGQSVGLLSQGQLGISCNAVTAATSVVPGAAGGCTSLNLLTSGGSLPGIYTWQVITTGSPASVTVTLQGSLDGVTWTQLDTTSAAGTKTTTSGTAFRFLGCIPSTLSGGSSPTVTCQISVTSTPASSGGTVGANSGSAGALAFYAAGGGSTTVGPDAALTDASNKLTYTGTSGITSSAGPLISGATGVQGCLTLFGATSGSSQVCAVGNGTEWDWTTAATFHFPPGTSIGTSSGSLTISPVSNLTLAPGLSITTGANCSAVGTAANPSVASCAAALAGSFSCATNASTGTCVVNTTNVTANSEIFVTQRSDTTTGTRLGVTCNATLSTVITEITAVTAATSFTINLGTITTNPECFSYFIIN